MIFDTHAHYNDKRFEEDQVGLLLSMKENNVGLITEISASKSDFKETLELTQKYDFIYGTIGVHPDEVEKLNDSDLDLMEKYLKEDKMVAVGEFGLDYASGDESVPKDIQEKWFRNQIELARKTKKPIVVHSRDACEDTFKIMTSEHCEDIGGVVHCFSYSPEIALEYIKMGFYIGVGGVVTFKNGKKLKEVVKQIPIERIVLETDCPYLAPTPYRGKRNDSTLIKYVAMEIASLKGIDVEDVIAITEQNGKDMYRIK